MSFWGIMVFAMIHLIIISTLVFYRRQTGVFIASGLPSQRASGVALTCLGGSVTMLAGTSSNMRELLTVFLPLGVLCLIVGVILLSAASRREPPTSGRCS